MSGRFASSNFNRAGYERELTGLREVLRTPDVSAPATEVELTELRRLVEKYPDNARYLVAQLPPAAGP